MSDIQLRIRDAGHHSRYGETSMKVLYKWKDRQNPNMEGKVSVANLVDGTLVIAVSTSVSELCNHFDLLRLEERISCTWKGGAFYRVDWDAQSVEVYGKSTTIGPIPPDVISIVQLELTELLNQFLLTK